MQAKPFNAPAQAGELVEKAVPIIGKLTYQDVADCEIDRAERLYNAGMTEAADEIKKTLDGGRCDRCFMEYDRVDVDIWGGGIPDAIGEVFAPKRHFATFAYYVPACRCYPRCRKVIKIGDSRVDIGCGKALVEEFQGAVYVKKYEKDGQEKNLGRYVSCSKCGTEIRVESFFKRGEE